MAQGNVAVIGAGPAGLAAATLLARHGADVTLLDEQPEPGGQIYRGVERASPALLGILGSDYAHGLDLVRAFRVSGVDYRPGSAVWQVTPDREVWFSRNGASALIRASAVIVATGAMERPVPVPGWTLPGVMTAGAVQILLKSTALRPTRRMVLIGSGPLFWLLAQQCAAAGIRPAAILDTNTGAAQLGALRHLGRGLRGEGWRYLMKGLRAVATAQRSGVPIFRAVHDVRIEGTDRVAAVAFRTGEQQHRMAADLVALHEGVIPSQQMTRAIGCAHVWDEAQRAFRPQTDLWGNSSVPGILVAGDGAGIGGARAAEHSGRLAALETLHRLGRLDTGSRDTLATADLRGKAAHLTVRGFLDTLYAPREEILRPAGDVTVCRCEEVSAAAIRGVVQQGCPGPNQAKAFLRAGMGPCQGRLCGPVVSELIAAARGVPVADVGYYHIRPPLKPITVGELAALDVAE